MTSPLKLGLFGAQGRMGRRVVECAATLDNFALYRALDRDDEIDFLKCDVVIDFSTHTATERLYEHLAGTEIPLVTGVTGRNETERELIGVLSETRPVFAASNFSIGIAVLNELVTKAVKMLGDEFAAEILEVHHEHKMDAPSGTALSLGETIAKAKDSPWPESRTIREGIGLPCTQSEIGVASLRGGDVVGDHTVFLLGVSERLELTHRAGNRALFARGALRAARWIVSQSPGLYGMNDLLKR